MLHVCVRTFDVTDTVENFLGTKQCSLHSPPLTSMLGWIYPDSWGTVQQANHTSIIRWMKEPRKHGLSPAWHDWQSYTLKTRKSMSQRRNGMPLNQVKLLWEWMLWAPYSASDWSAHCLPIPTCYSLQDADRGRCRYDNDWCPLTFYPQWLTRA